MRAWAGWLAVAAIGCGVPGGARPGGPDAGAADGGGPQLTVPPGVQVPIDPTTTPVDPVVVTPAEPEKPLPDFTFRPLQTEVKVYSVQLAEADYQALIADPYDDGRPATFTVDGKQLPCTFRVRGGSSRHYPKKSWRIDLPDGTKYGGRKKINLVSELADRTFMVEKLGFDLLAAMGVPASNASYVRLYVNGRFEGLYLDIERVDKAFLDAHAFADTDADIFRCGDQDCEMKLYRNEWQGEWEKQTNETTGFDPLWSFLGMVNHTPEPDFAKTLEAQFEVGRYLRSMTMDALLSNDIIMDSNDYLIRDRFTKKWTYVPWDLNNANARWWPTYPLNQGPACDGGEGWCDWTRDHPVDDSALVVWSVRDGWLNRLYDERSFGPAYTPAFSNLTTRIVENPELRARYLATLEQALEKLFTPEVMNARLEAMHALIAPYAKDDPGLKVMPDAVVVNGVSQYPADPDGLAKFEDGVAYLKTYVRNRSAFLRKEIARLRALTPTLAIERVDPVGKTVTLKNRSASAQSLAGKILTTNVRHLTASICGAHAGTCRIFPDTAPTLAPGEEYVVDFADGGPALPPEGELGLFDGQRVTGVKDVFFYGKLSAGSVYARDAEGVWKVAAGR